MAALTKNVALASALPLIMGDSDCCSLLLGVLPVVVGLLDLHLEVVPVHHVLLDLVDWQLDEHTGDLGSLVVADEALHELVDASTDLLLQVRVVWVKGWNVLGRGGKVSLLDRVALHHLLLRLLRHLWHTWLWCHWLLALHWHWLLLLLHHSLLWWHLLTHLSWVHW